MITTQLKVLFSIDKKSPVPANLSSGEDQSVAQVIISSELSIVKCLFKTGNQELYKNMKDTSIIKTKLFIFKVMIPKM